MSGTMKKRYISLLAEEMVSLFDVSHEVALKAIHGSSFMGILKTYPEHVDHVALSTWAYEIHNEMFS